MANTTKKAATKKASTKSAGKRSVASPATDYGEPKFPYTTEPQALGRLLTEIPKRPKPTRVTMDTLKAWSVSSNNNARTAISVLKKIGLLGAGGEPLDAYVEFMKSGTGPVVLGQKLKDVYRILFENSHSPQTESTEELKKLFNIHSGGGEEAMRLQLNTFKVLAEHATFEEIKGAKEGTVNGAQNLSGNTSGGVPQMPPIQIDLHIHLPENKSSRDYESIIQDIARYIYGRNLDVN